MFFVIFLSVFTLFTITPCRIAMATSAPPLRFLTFNVLHGGVFSGLWGNAQDLEQRIEMIGKEFRTLDADVIGLQEASAGHGRGNIAERLANELGFHYAYAPAIFRFFSSGGVNTVISRLMNFSEGPAILSRFPITTWEAYDLPRCGNFTDRRVLLCAWLGTPWGPLQACSTHISGKVCQAEALVELLRSRHSAPLILMGDFNAPEDSPTISVLTKELGLIDTFRTVNPGVPGFTVWQWVYAPSPTVFRRVDYIFWLPQQEFRGKVLSSGLVLNTPQPLRDGMMLWPSDHYGVLTEVAVFPPTP